MSSPFWIMVYPKFYMKDPRLFYRLLANIFRQPHVIKSNLNNIFRFHMMKCGVNPNVYKVIIRLGLIRTRANGAIQSVFLQDRSQTLICLDGIYRPIG